jgi:hypothetical protein
MADVNDDGNVTEQEINDAIAVLEKSKKDNQRNKQRQMFTLYGNYIDTSFKSNY